MSSNSQKCEVLHDEIEALRKEIERVKLASDEEQKRKLEKERKARHQKILEAEIEILRAKKELQELQKKKVEEARRKEEEEARKREEERRQKEEERQRKQRAELIAKSELELQKQREELEVKKAEKEMEALRRKLQIEEVQQLLQELLETKQMFVVREEMNAIKENLNREKKAELRRKLVLLEKKRELDKLEREKKKYDLREENANIDYKIRARIEGDIKDKMAALELEIGRCKDKWEAIDMTIDINPVSWESYWGEWKRAKFHSYECDLAEDGILQFRHVNTIDFSVTVKEKPFAQGSFRFAYYLKRSDGRRMVAKSFCYRLSPELQREEMLEIVKLHSLSANFAQNFNRRKPSPANSMSFGVIYLMELVDRSPPVLMTAEDCLNGEFEKYNNNNGFVKDGHPDPQAFSHFTYEFSKNKFLLVDVQGTRSGNIYQLTDPAFHTSDGIKFGETNMGRKGVDFFFKSHICSSTCKALGLKHLY